MSAHNGNGTGNHVRKHGEWIPGRNGGWLRNGGTNKGGPGRPPSKIREAARDGFEALLPTLVKVAKSPKESTTDRLRAIDLLAKYGLGTTITETDTDGNDVARARLSPDEVAEHVARIVAQR